MKSEKEYVYELETEVSDLNRNSVLKPYAYQVLFSRLVEPHLSRIHADIKTTMRSNLAWALVSLSFEIVRPVTGCIKLLANTWHAENRGPFFRRDFIFRNEAGEIMFQGASYSILLDLDKRSIYRGKEIPIQDLTPIKEFAIEASPTNKLRKKGLELCKVDERRVYNSYIDCIGHVNNCRYGEFAYDALTGEECDGLDKLKRMDIFFLSELKQDERFSIHKAYDENRIYIRGYNETREEAAFEFNLEF